MRRGGRSCSKNVVCPELGRIRNRMNDMDEEEGAMYVKLLFEGASLVEVETLRTDWTIEVGIPSCVDYL